MFETAELGRRIPKEEYKHREPILRQELLEAQQELLQARRFPTIVYFIGVDGAGKSQTVNLLNAWMDPRWLATRAYGQPSDEERDRPELWRFWRDLPPKGQIGLFLSAWYSRPLLDRVYRHISLAEFDECLDRISAFENMLADDGALILKFWMHLSRDAQKRRLKALEKDPLTRWQIKKSSWDHWRIYDRFMAASERVIQRTNSAKAPITIVEGVDPCYRSLTVGTLIRNAVRTHLQEMRLKDKLHSELETKPFAANVDAEIPVPAPANETIATPAAIAAQEPILTVLTRLRMDQQLNKPQYRTELKKYQSRLNLLHSKALEKGISTLLVFEGWDAAGKGGAIRRVTASLDARNYRVRPFAAPNDEEKSHHYLWRFWRHLSRAGRFTIYDRSWYGRVLVERVEGFATEAEWKRAYAEINAFEAELIGHGLILMKYWLHVTKDEQLSRFKAREQTPYKSWKLTDEDWRNRDKWDLYELAVNDMVQYTSTREAPWTLVEANDKRYARIKVLKTLCHKLEQMLGNDG